MTGPSRSAITLAQKRALRLQAHENPTMLKKDLQAWFQTSFGQTIAPSSVSEILSFRYEYLDEEIQNHSLAKRKKDRREKWPELEEQLACWIMYMVEKQQQEVDEGGGEEILSKTPMNMIPGRLIREKAQSLWRDIAAYQREEVPSFSNCWIQRFWMRCQDRSRLQTQRGGPGTANEMKGNQHQYKHLSLCDQDFDGRIEEEDGRLEQGCLPDCEVMPGFETWDFDDIINDLGV